MIIVTGGTRGIGRGIVEALAAEHRVVAFWNSTAPRDLPAGVASLQADLSAAEACRTAIATLPEGEITGIVNNAGLVTPSAIEGFDAAAIEKMFAVNTIAPAILLAEALPRMGAGASVVNISSVNADLPPMGAAFYGASKAALNLWTRAAAKELGPKGIRVNAVAPGASNTPDNNRSDELTARFVELTALGRVGAPADIAGVVRFLMSPDAAFISGEVIRVSGGYRL